MNESARAFAPGNISGVFKVIPDDDPFHVPTITFHAPSLARNEGLRIKITEVLP